jgi:uncharacterized protein with HEPN domain
MPRDDALITDILVAARKITRHADGLTREEFAANETIQDAVLWQIGIIGEAARKVSQEFKDMHPEIPWHEMSGMRNRLVHDYSRIDLAQVWDTVRRSIPELIRLLEPLVSHSE